MKKGLFLFATFAFTAAGIVVTVSGSSSGKVTLVNHAKAVQNSRIITRYLCPGTDSVILPCIQGKITCTPVGACPGS